EGGRRKQNGRCGEGRKNETCRHVIPRCPAEHRWWPRAFNASFLPVSGLHVAGWLPSFQRPVGGVDRLGLACGRARLRIRLFLGGTPSISTLRALSNSRPEIDRQHGQEEGGGDDRDEPEGKPHASSVARCRSLGTG